MIYFAVICAIIGAVSLVTLALYGADKRRAVKNRWRIRESTLLLLSFFGGALGGWLGMILFRHKIRKAKFIFINLLGILWQAAAIISAAIFLV